jgi:hypothetical protein
MKLRRIALSLVLSSGIVTLRLSTATSADTNQQKSSKPRSKGPPSFLHGKVKLASSSRHSSHSAAGSLSFSN